MVRMLYNLAWTLAVLPFVPVIPFFGNRRLLERSGLRLPPRRENGRPIWIHALSVGEVNSAIPIVDRFMCSHPGRKILFTVATSQGMTIARAELQDKVQEILTMPVDLWWSVKKIVDYIRPSLFILVETDLWPGLIWHLKKRGVKTILVNGRISPRTYRQYHRFSFLSRMMLADVALCLMQSELDRERLLGIGIRASKVKTVGNIKFDRDWKPMDKEERDQWFHDLGLEASSRLWVAGSTHEGEEETLLEVFAQLRSSHPTLQLIMAPRRIERGEAILALCRDKGFNAVLRTSGLKRGSSFDVQVLNSLGELGRIYGLSDVNFVGGSLVPVGGHNPLEPAFFGRPVLFGPHIHNFVLISELLTEAGGGKMVEDGKDLFQTMNRLLSDDREAEDMGRRAMGFVKANRGATDRIMAHLEAYIP